VSRNCNLLQHDDEPLDRYLNTLCHPPLLIKWYGFDPKTKKKKELEHQKNVKNVSMHQENDRKDKKKIINFEYFQHPSILFPMSSTFLVLSPLSPITPLHTFCQHCRPPQLMSLVGCPQPSAEPIFTRHVLGTNI